MNYYSQVTCSILAGLLFLIGNVSVGFSAETLEFEAEGRIVYRTFNRDGKVRVEHPGTFGVAVKGEQWLVRLDLPTFSPEDYEVGCDGKDVYRLSQLNTNKMDFKTLVKMKKSLANVRTNSHISAKGVTYPGKAPVATGGANVCPVWLAFASVGYFQGITNEYVRPVWQRLSDPYRKVMPVSAQWKFSSLSASFIEEVTYRSDGMTYSGDIHKRAMIKERAPFDQGYVKARFKVTSFMNASDFVLPKKFFLATYTPRPGGIDTNDTIKSASWECETTMVRVDLKERSFLPALSGRTRIVDYRFGPEGSGRSPIAVRYNVTNTWAKTNDPGIATAVRQYLKYGNPNTKSVRYRSGRAFFWLVVTTMTFSVIAIIVYHQMRIPKKTCPLIHR